nr:DUF2625 family protein [Streptomyces sp. CS227]
MAWLLSGRAEAFYDGLRWPGRREDAAALRCSQGIAVYPFLWSEDAQADLSATSRRPVPMREVLAVSADVARRTGRSIPGFSARCEALGRRSTAQGRPLGSAP